MRPRKKSITIATRTTNKNDRNNRFYNIKDNEQSGNVNWWFNELDSPGIKKDIDIAST
jgi:hypothetical protein